MLVFLLFFLSASLAIPLNHTVTKREIKAGDPFDDVIDGVNRRCYWVGTSPFCNGECPDIFDEVTRDDVRYNYYPCWPWDGNCHTSCYWDGTAPFCGGECGPKSDEIERRGALYVPPDCKISWHISDTCPSDDRFDKPCEFWTTKALCCRKIQID